MAELSIKITIANRVYPLKVNEEEEVNIRNAAKRINEKVKDYAENFSVRDNQDLLAMCALQFANELLTNESKLSSGNENLTGQLTEIDNIITAVLEKSPS